MGDNVEYYLHQQVYPEAVYRNIPALERRLAVTKVVEDLTNDKKVDVHVQGSNRTGTDLLSGNLDLILGVSPPHSHGFRRYFEDVLPARLRNNRSFHAVKYIPGLVPIIRMKVTRGGETFSIHVSSMIFHSKPTSSIEIESGECVNYLQGIKKEMPLQLQSRMCGTLGGLQSAWAFANLVPPSRLLCVQDATLLIKHLLRRLCVYGSHYGWPNGICITVMVTSIAGFDRFHLEALASTSDLVRAFFSHYSRLDYEADTIYLAEGTSKESELCSRYSRVTDKDKQGYEPMMVLTPAVPPNNCANSMSEPTMAAFKHVLAYVAHKLNGPESSHQTVEVLIPTVTPTSFLADAHHTHYVGVLMPLSLDEATMGRVDSSIYLLVKQLWQQPTQRPYTSCVPLGQPVHVKHKFELPGDGDAQSSTATHVAYFIGLHSPHFTDGLTDFKIVSGAATSGFNAWVNHLQPHYPAITSVQCGLLVRARPSFLSVIHLAGGEPWKADTMKVGGAVAKRGGPGGGGHKRQRTDGAAAAGAALERDGDDSGGPGVEEATVKSEG